MPKYLITDTEPSLFGCICNCSGQYVWHRGRPTCDNCGTFVTSDTEYCGVPLVGGWCKRPKDHGGSHVCS